MAVAHKDSATGQFVIDVVRGVAPPFDPEAATEQFAKLAKDYRVTRVAGDAYGEEWVASAWGRLRCPLRQEQELRNRRCLFETLPLWTRGLV